MDISKEVNVVFKNKVELSDGGFIKYSVEKRNNKIFQVRMYYQNKNSTINLLNVVADGELNVKEESVHILDAIYKASKGLICMMGKINFFLE